MRVHPIKWYDEKYKVPRDEKIVLRCCSKEGGPVDHLITVAERFPDKMYKLYKVVFESLTPSIPKSVKLLKVAKNPIVLEDMVFGK